MINDIITAISIAICKEFGDDYTIYADQIKQGLKEPCFFVFCLNPTNNHFLGKKYLRTNLFCIQYFPKGCKANRNCHDVAETLQEQLEYIVMDNDLIQGTKMKHEIVDGVLSFFINYDMFVYKIEEKTTMGEQKFNGRVKE